MLPPLPSWVRAAVQHTRLHFILPAGYTVFSRTHIYTLIHTLTQCCSRPSIFTFAVSVRHIISAAVSSITSTNSSVVLKTAILSEVALTDVNKIPESQRMNGSSSNGKLTVPLTEVLSENTEPKRKEKMASLVELPNEKEGPENSAVEAAIAEVEYIESENLEDVNDVDNCLETLLSGLGSKNWVSVCDALNNVRRLSIYHKESLVDMLSDVISLVLKSLKNPRSALCKTAIMTSADIFEAYNDEIIGSLDPLLVQLLLKSSQDKRFVCEAAERALNTLTTSVSPLLLLPKLQPHTKHKNPRIRAKASTCISRSVPRLGKDGIEAFGIDKLIQIGASQLSDQLPESRDAARTLLLELQSVYEKSHAVEPTATSEEAALDSWEHFCQSNLSPLSAQAVLRVTSSARHGVVSGS